MDSQLRRRWTFGSLLGFLLLVVGLTVVGGRGVGAQEATPIPTTLPGTVSVTGTGRVTIEPDTAAITLGVTVFEANLSEAQARATSEMTAIIEAVTAAGVDEADIQTSNYSVNIRQEYDQNGNPSKVIGYDINNSVTVTIRDLDSLGGTLDAVVQAGANTIYGISFYTFDTTDATAQARAAAVVDARAHADQLAAAANVEVGRIVTMVEGGSAAPPPILYEKAFAMDDTSMAASAPVPVQVGTQEIQVQVMVTYEIEQS